jgi:predicted Zn-dependent protease
MIQPLIWALMYFDLYFTGTTSGLGRWAGSLLLDLGVMKPSSRQQESEADYVGLLLMAQSCYDPEEAVGLWERMEQAQKDAPPEWLSTHPSVSRPFHKLSLSNGVQN